MNERNVAALRELVDTWRQQQSERDPEGQWFDGFSEFLAAQGALAPRGLTPRQMALAGEVVEREMAGSGANDPEAFEVCVRLLERLAKGMI